MRCIKPNALKSAKKFDDEVVEKQVYILPFMHITQHGFRQNILFAVL